MVFGVFSQTQPAKFELAVNASHVVAAFVFLDDYIAIGALLVFVSPNFSIDFHQNVLIVLIIK